MNKTSFNEMCYWNNSSYGSAYRIKGSTIKLIASIVCLVTPGTNWIIPILYKLNIKNKVIRYES